MNPRYLKQILLPEIGLKGQAKLSQARVLCVGAGGLGSSALLYLTGAGIGHIGIVDHDNVSLDNLQRQVLYQEGDIGQPKAIVAAKRLKALNSEIIIEPIQAKLDKTNCLALNQYDFILDCTDNFKTKLLLNDNCHQSLKPLITASVQGLSGQCAVFWPPLSGCWRCIYPDLNENTPVGSCNDNGVLGMVPGMLGMQQALEVVKLCLELPSLLGKLAVWDLFLGTYNVLQAPKNPLCKVCSI